ncbi:MAG: type II toxin-antitoxin system RelE/ParE family toxin [Candidatus Acidiferrales bacterium]|jgi:hypothetical protein
MSWNVEATDEFQAWWATLNEQEHEAIFAGVALLELRGPSLGRPWVDTLARDSKHPNMKELRVQCKGKPYRILFAFDPRQTGILLIGGQKSGKKWTQKAVALADKIYDAYLKEIRREGLIE